MNHDTSKQAESHWEELFQRHLADDLSDAEFAELENLLKASEDARIRYHQACRLDSIMRRRAEVGDQHETDLGEPRVPVVPRWKSWIAFAGVAAALALLGMTLLEQWRRPETVATLVSTEGASWQSSESPVGQDALLQVGTLKLESGLATVMFHSGAAITLEGPAQLRMETPMHAEMLAGAATIEVPDSAVGFVLTTPQGVATDYGTAFAVRVGEDSSRVDFEVLEGEIGLRAGGGGEEFRLLESQSASIESGELAFSDQPGLEPVAVAADKTFKRLGTGGRTTSIIRNNGRKWLDPDLLMAISRNKQGGGGHDRRGVFGFDLASVDFERVESVAIRLNQVPSGRGFASRLPEMNRFAVYGIELPDREIWDLEPQWQDIPAAEEATRVGFFEIPRSQQRGTVRVSGDALMQYLQERAGGEVAFLIVRESGGGGSMESSAAQGRGILVHAFAGSTHPEASGPKLEFQLRSVVGE